MPKGETLIPECSTQSSSVWPQSRRWASLLARSQFPVAHSAYFTIGSPWPGLASKCSPSSFCLANTYPPFRAQLKCHLWWFFPTIQRGRCSPQSSVCLGTPGFSPWSHYTSHYTPTFPEAISTITSSQINASDLQTSWPKKTDGSPVWAGAAGHPPAGASIPASNSWAHANNNPLDLLPDLFVPVIFATELGRCN